MILMSLGWLKTTKKKTSQQLSPIMSKLLYYHYYILYITYPLPSFLSVSLSYYYITSDWIVCVAFRPFSF